MQICFTPKSLHNLECCLVGSQIFAWRRKSQGTQRGPAVVGVWPLVHEELLWRRSGTLQNLPHIWGLGLPSLPRVALTSTSACSVLSRSVWGGHSVGPTKPLLTTASTTGALSGVASSVRGARLNVLDLPDKCGPLPGPLSVKLFPVTAGRFVFERCPPWTFRGGPFLPCPRRVMRDFEQHSLFFVRSRKRCRATQSTRGLVL